jgi:hypothetical protein
MKLISFRITDYRSINDTGEIEVHPLVLGALLEERWDEARAIASTQQFGGPYTADGLAVVAGPTWVARYADPGAPPERRT